MIEIHLWWGPSRLPPGSPHPPSADLFFDGTLLTDWLPFEVSRSTVTVFPRSPWWTRQWSTRSDESSLMLLLQLSASPWELPSENQPVLLTIFQSQRSGMAGPFPFCVSKCHRHVWKCHSEDQWVLWLTGLLRLEMRWSRSARSTLVPPGVLLRNVQRCQQRLLICRLSFTQIPASFSPGCLHGNQKGKGSSGRKEPQQKDNFSDICKSKWSNSKGGKFPGSPCRDCRHLPHIQFKAKGWIPGTATLRRPLKVSIERLLLYSSSIEAESDLSKTGVHIRDIRPVERVWI